MKRLSWLFAGGAVLLAACAPTMERIDLVAPAGGLRSVAVPNFGESQAFQMRMQVAATGALGGGGMAIDQGVEKAGVARANTFVEQLNARSIRFAPKLFEELQASLASRSVSATYLADQGPRAAADGSDDYSAIRTDADAILSVWYGEMGYLSPPLKFGYQPWVVVKARLIEPQTQKVRYFRAFTAGYEAPNPGIEHIDCDPKYRFENYDQIAADFDRAVAGLMDCQKRIAERIAADITQPPRADRR